ncbi:hypothetical protein ABI_42480 [Asticcacaulis biprosthecium C19]|uniref:Uncharacterized protein n=1 Tax=Asticcacaulis biprosthecium C19 TaxID=715226 RepID=F4QSV5_9CAUL|nr:hypothetical protein [Asticcacaulis biprosthecium]EGF89825.1 hypothetical protein ABI_42480 [Asticcacaulis biprosthecium C19]
MRKLALALLSTISLMCAAPAQAYPPKPQDWETLSANNAAFLGAWDAFVYSYQPGGGKDLDEVQAELTQQMVAVNAACTQIRDQIGSGMLFGPEQWTKGFAHTCWALASFQKAGGRNLADKVCGETKDALNFFTAFKPKKWPADYPQAQEHIAQFSDANHLLREVLFDAGAKQCKPLN